MNGFPRDNENAQTLSHTIKPISVSLDMINLPTIWWRTPLCGSFIGFCYAIVWATTMSIFKNIHSTTRSDNGLGQKKKNYFSTLHMSFVPKLFLFELVHLGRFQIFCSMFSQNEKLVHLCHPSNHRDMYFTISHIEI